MLYLFTLWPVWLSSGLTVRRVAFTLGRIVLFAGTAAVMNGSVDAAPAPPRATSYPVPRFNLPTNGNLTGTQVASLNRQTRLERLTAATTGIYDIIPPVPRDVIPAGPLPGYQILRLGRGHNNRLCVAATVAGTKGLMMIDTGLSNTALSDGTYRALALNAAAKLPAGVPRSVSLNGTNARLAEAPDFRVGKVNLGAVPVCLVSRRYLFDAGPGEGKGQLYDGLLGQNILRHYSAMIDCARLVLYLDHDPAKKLDLASSLVRNGWTRVPMMDTGTHFAVPCTVNGRRFRLIVDTGSPFTNLDRNLLTAARVGTHDLPFRSGLIGTDAEPASLVDLDRLQIGGYTATDVHMTATTQSLAAFGGRSDRSADIPIVGLLGGDILARNGAIIDMGTGSLYLKHPDRQTAKGR